MNEHLSGWTKARAPVQAFLIDAVLIWLGILMVEFLMIAFSGRRSPTGFFLLAEEILDLLHYGRAVAASY